MDIRPEHDDEVRAERPEVYEPPTLDEVGEFTALTRAASTGHVVDGTAYYSQ
jgi:hypothetical protein